MPNLSAELIKEIQEIAAKYPTVQKVVLFGSRARGDNRPNSDIDLAVWTAGNFDEQGSFTADLEELNTLLKIDLAFINETTNQTFLDNIQKEGVALVDTAATKAANLYQAVQRLQESIHSDSVRDGAIQRFEFCCELAWKALRDYLTAEGFTAPNSPRSVFKEAFAAGFLSEEGAWLQLLNDRNATSHIYDEHTADVIYDRIVTIYVDLLSRLAAQLNR